MTVSHSGRNANHAPRGPVLLKACQAHTPSRPLWLYKQAGQGLWGRQANTAVASCDRCPGAIETGPAKGHGAGAFLYTKRWVEFLEVGRGSVPGDCMGRAVGGMCSDVPYPDPPELLGSTKRLNINYQDADGYVLLGKEQSPGAG